MKPVRRRTGLLVALAATATAWVLLETWAGRSGSVPPLSWTAIVATAAMTAAVLAAGLPVRRWVRGRRDRALDPLVAARTAVLARAAIYGGAVLIGWYLAQSLVLVPDLVGARRTRFVVGLVAAATALALALAGYVVQHWCRVPPEDDEDDN